MAKKRDIEKELKKCGWWLDRQGSNHEIWTNGEDKIPLARHNEIPEVTSKSILKTARAKKRK